MRPDLIKQMQRYVAETCVGASAIRNQGGSGLIQAARDYFNSINLASVPRDAHQMNLWLDKHTRALLRRFPEEARFFGTARKALNLFLRSAAYNAQLQQAFRLKQVLPLLEVPVDSYTSAHLLAWGPGIAGRWKGLKQLSEMDHAAYQAFAQTLARRWRIHRVDLDVYFYREEVPST